MREYKIANFVSLFIPHPLDIIIFSVSASLKLCETAKQLDETITTGLFLRSNRKYIYRQQFIS